MADQQHSGAIPQELQNKGMWKGFMDCQSNAKNGFPKGYKTLLKSRTYLFQLTRPGLKDYGNKSPLALGVSQ